ncbi:MAG: biotin/lipoyl-binding protein, partial [Ottowia sp.]|uniref:biotin/lipoyl-binding protein n=1 Tax=Ottowia sp. TaxID=1898956 RepID=UPI003C71A606
MRLLASCLTLMIVACTPVPPQGWSGYAEGDYIYMAAPIGGSLEQLAVQPGDQVRAGAALFVLEDEAERAAEAQAGAQLEAARAQAANIQTGRRPEEIAVIRSQLAQARAQALLAQEELARRQTLTPGGAVSASELDTARATAAQTRARVGELEASLRTAELPARADERVAAQA